MADETVVGFGDWRVETVTLGEQDQIRVTVNEVNETGARTFRVDLPIEAARDIGAALVHTAALFDDD